MTETAFNNSPSHASKSRDTDWSMTREAIGWVNVDGPALFVHGCTVATNVTAEDAEKVLKHARLIEQAPELAEALRIFEDAYQTGRNEPLVIASEHARTVLARLEGK